MLVLLCCPSCAAGWTGGPYGVGYRFKLRHTRAIVDAIHSGELTAAEYETMPTFNLQVGAAVGVHANGRLPPGRGGGAGVHQRRRANNAVVGR